METCKLEKTTCLQTTQPFRLVVRVVVMNVEVREWSKVYDMWIPLADFRSLRGRKVMVMVACSTLDLSQGDGEKGGSEEEPGGHPPDGSLMLGGLQQASVVGHDLVLMEVQVEL